MFGLKKDKSHFSTANWHLHGYYTTKTLMDREIKKLNRDGYKTRYKRSGKGRYKLEAKAT